ncbi:MAG: ComEC/Rec2 family competence protein [Erysipelotrichaceae bacterium]|nr:ComEC/Rec2 family competence protein [Erysipelotrichaceae bacterium]
MVILLIFLCFWLGLSLRYNWIILAILGLFLLIFILKRHGRKVFTISSIFILLGCGVSFISFDWSKSQYHGVVFEAKENYFLFLSGGERLYCYQKNHPYEIGDYLTIKGDKNDLNFSQIESAFDFESYLEKKGVTYRLYADYISVNFRNPLRIRSYQNWFLSHFDEQSKSLVQAILFSHQDDSEIIQSIKDLHLFRLVSTSGLYLAAFIAFLEFILSFKLKEKWTKLFALIILCFYGLFTFPRFSVLRILFMNIFWWINNYRWQGKLKSHDILGLLGLMFLFIDYHLAYQDAFILGFSIPIFYSFIRTITRKFKKPKRTILEMLFIALFFIPFELKYYHSLSLFSALFQIILSPVFILFGCSALLSFYGLPIYRVIELCAKLITIIIKPVSYLGIEIYSGELNQWTCVLYYLLYGIFIYYYSIGFRPIYHKIEFLMVSVLIIHFIPSRNFISQQVSFINVGQGDACLIREQNRTILIDTGGSLYQDIATECLIPFFRKQKIYHLDYVITTHDDYDHCGALPSLIANFRVGKYIEEASDFPLTYGNITINNYNQHIVSSNEENENSLVLGFHLLKKDFLIMGDAPIAVEKVIMSEYANIPCDILKVGHHGSNTSSSEAFIQYLHPQEAVISVGFNYYGHPHDSVIQTLEKYHIEIKRTDQMGTIDYFNYIFM